MKEQHMDTARLDVLLSLAKQTPSLGAFLLRLQELKEHMDSREPQAGSNFILSTIHASKGLEYERVILLDAVDGILPSSITPKSAEDYTALEEERRLFYVGATRAKRQLEFLCYETKFGEPLESGFNFVSQFLGEQPKQQRTAPQPEKKAPARNAGPSAEQISVWMKDYIPGTEVTHRHFGRGLITSRNGNVAVIAFRELGVKKVDLPTCLRQNKIELTYLM